MKKKISLSIIISLLIGIVLGFYTGKYVYQAEPVDIVITIPDSVIEEETKYIDSLYSVEQKIEEEKKGLETEIRIIREEKIKEVNHIKKLPTDEGVKFLNNKLREYETIE